MRRFARFVLPVLVVISAPALLSPPAPGCAEAPCRICFAVAEAVDRAGGEPIACAA